MRRIAEVQDPDLKRVERRFLFFCPGCKCGHCFIVPRWTWNNSFDKPTFRPSLLTGAGAQFSKNRCHSYVTDGRIQFLPDCHHDLKNQTVDLPDLDEMFRSAGPAASHDLLS